MKINTNQIIALHSLMKGSLRQIEASLVEASYLHTQLTEALKKTFIPSMTDEINQYEEASDIRTLSPTLHPQTYQAMVDLEDNIEEFTKNRKDGIERYIHRSLDEVRLWKSIVESSISEVTK